MKPVKSTNTPTNIALLLLRTILAVVFIYHGSQKLFGAFGGPGIDNFAGWLASMNIPLPTFNAYMAASTEFFGGIALLIGLFTRLVAIPLTITMIVAIVTVHANAFSAQNNGMEYPLTLAFVLIAIILLGPGAFSLDANFNACKACNRSNNTKNLNPQSA